MIIFEKFRIYLTKFNIGDVITRKEIMSQKFGCEVTIDNYRNHFSKAKYLKHIDRGKYQIIKNIPDNFHARELRREAYPHYKDWGEYSYLKNNK